jgi:hypothetical protein
LKEAYNHVPIHQTMQDLLVIDYQGRLYKYQGMPFGLNDAPSIHTNNEKSNSSDQRIVESKMCDLLGRLIDFTPRSKSPEKNYTPNYPTWVGLSTWRNQA